MRSKEKVPAREASSTITSWFLRNVVPMVRWLCHHFTVFSVWTPRSSASTWAATAEGASPTTEPAPYSCSQARRSADMAVVLPAPAGPTSTSITRPDRAILANALTWSAPSISALRSGLAVTRSTVTSGTVGPVVVWARSRRQSSAASRASEENRAECLGRNTLVPSGRRNSAGLDASSGGVSRSDTASAASTTIARTASRSTVVANR